MVRLDDSAGSDRNSDSYPKNKSLGDVGTVNSGMAAGRCWSSFVHVRSFGKLRLLPLLCCLWTDRLSSRIEFYRQGSHINTERENTIVFQTIASTQKHSLWLDLDDSGQRRNSFIRARRSFKLVSCTATAGLQSWECSPSRELLCPTLHDKRRLAIDSRECKCVVGHDKNAGLACLVVSRR